MLLIQEIYGVSDYIRAVAEDLAGLGYVVAAPDLFWRLQPGYQAAHDDAGPGQVAGHGVPVRRRAGRRRRHRRAGPRLAALPEVDGGIGIIGFCLGGSIAYLVAAQTPLDAVVSFYGSAVPDQLGLWTRSPRRSSSTSAAATRTSRVTRWPSRKGGRASPTWSSTWRKRPGTPSTPQGAHVPPARACRPRLAAHRGFLRRHLPAHKNVG